MRQNDKPALPGATVAFQLTVFKGTQCSLSPDPKFMACMNYAALGTAATRMLPGSPGPAFPLPSLSTQNLQVAHAPQLGVEARV